MSSKPWYAWFPSDYRAKTAQLNFIQDSAYRRLIDAYYDRRGPLPIESSALHRIASAQSKAERNAVDFVAKQFFTNGGGQLHHARCDEQLAKEQALHEGWVEAGRKGGLRQAQARLDHPNPTLNPRPRLTPNPIKSKNKAQAPFVLPDWIPQEHWDAWIESRKKCRKPPTDYALRLAVRKLDNFRTEGHPPAQVLMQSAFNGWAGLFPPKEIK